MNAEALVGTVLGTCTLQQLIGQGGMGAVYLAQQSRPRRQVAVKVLLPTTPLKPQHLAAFLERFRRETDAAASLEHPNIMPVYEYGEQDGLAYLVMPYIAGGTLRDVMEREGQMQLPKVINYLEQLAAALDFAHARGVVHRDIKPANILITPEGRALLTDFGLVKIVSEGGRAHTRLTGAGAPVGTPDYMSPEQVIGDEVDGRADLYSLGIILFQMLTSTTPFQGEIPMQIAAQQLHAQPPLPRRFRPDLPEAAQQVILKSLAKRPADRFASGLELATAFRLAFSSLDALSTQMHRFDTSEQSGGLDGSGFYARKGLFDPTWQTGALLPAVNAQNASAADFGGSTPSGSVPAVRPGMLGIPGTPTRTSGLLSRTGLFPSIGSGALPAMNRELKTPASTFSASADAATAFGQSGVNQLSTDSYAVPGSQSLGPTVKLTGPVKVVQVPVAPGQYVTGLLPVPSLGLSPTPEPPRNPRVALLKKIMLCLVIVLVLLGGSLSFMLVRSHLSQQHDKVQGIVGTPNIRATQIAQALATTQANTILTDALSTNIRNLPEGTTPTRVFAFKGGAYHITNLGNQGVAVVVPFNLPNVPMIYQMTMNEVRGDDTSPVNSFGLIFRYTQQTQNGSTVSTFYTFEVVNTTGANGKYWFYKYNSSSTNPWTPIWSQSFGPEFNQGQGPKAINTIKVLMNGSNFAFVINGKLINTKPVVDKSYPTGKVGMLVNLNGTEVAFKNLSIVALPH